MRAAHDAHWHCVHTSASLCQHVPPAPSRRSHTPPGIFIPALACGAAGGRLTGQLLRHAVRAAGISVEICLPGWSVMGATAMLVGTTRLTLANLLIVLESSGCEECAR